MCTKHRSGPALPKTVDIKGEQIQIPDGWEVVTEGRVQVGDSLYNLTFDRFEPALATAIGIGVGSRFCVIRKTSLLESGLANQRKAKEALVALKGEAPIELGPKETIMVTHNYNGRKIKSIIPIGYEIVDDGVTLEGDRILQLYDDGGNSYNPAPVGFQVSAFTLVVRNAKPVFVDPKHLAKPGQAKLSRGTHIDKIFSEWMLGEGELAREWVALPGSPNHAAQSVVDLLMTMLEQEPHSMEHLLLERASVDEDIAHLAEVKAKSDCEFYMTGFTLVNTIVKKLTGNALVMEQVNSEILSIKVA